MLNRDLAHAVVTEIADAVSTRNLPEPQRWDDTGELPEELVSFFEMLGLDAPAPKTSKTFPQQWEERPDIDAYVRATNAKIVHGGARAYYHMGEDMIHLPDKGRFPTADAYYATLLHELTHWTRHPNRLNRPGFQQPGDASYCMEELVAELGSAMLMRSFGLSFPQAHYVDHYLQGVGHSPEAFVAAASFAVKAADYLNHFCGR